jgi:serine/threonine protein phosphatase 1
VRRLNQILLIDTGACYGGRLTAYCPESGDLLSVAGPAVTTLPSDIRPVDRRFAPVV